MNCHSANKNMEKYLSGKLKGRKEMAFKNHMESCGHCSTLLTNTLNTLSLLDEKPATLPSQPFLYTRIKQKIETKRAERAPLAFKPILQPAIYLSVLAITIFGGIKLGHYYLQKQTGDEYYIEAMAKSYYLDGLEIEPLERTFISETEEEYEDNH